MHKLIQPDAAYQTSYINYIDELGSEERYPFPLDFEHDDFKAMLQRIKDFQTGINLPDGYVPSTTYWLMQDDEIVGCTNVRHYLNSHIEHCGGHIGLGIRPRYRGQGFGKKLMKMSIEKAQLLGNDPIHIHCHSNNQASRSTIEACGGRLDSTIKVADAQVSRFLVWKS